MKTRLDHWYILQHRMRTNNRFLHLLPIKCLNEVKHHSYWFSVNVVTIFIPRVRSDSFLAHGASGYARHPGEVPGCRYTSQALDVDESISYLRNAAWLLVLSCFSDRPHKWLSPDLFALYKDSRTNAVASKCKSASPNEAEPRLHRSPSLFRHGSVQHGLDLHFHIGNKVPHPIF